MGSEILRPESRDADPTPTPEVEFALVLSRMIDSVNSDPEHLRATIYELARHKLHEQFKSGEFGDIGQLSKSLETAIRGVEDFSRRNGPAIAALPKPESAQRQQRALVDSPRSSVADVRSVNESAEAWLDGEVSRPGRFRFTAPWRFATAIAIALAVIFAMRQHGLTIGGLRRHVNRVVAVVRPNAAKPAQVLPPALSAAAGSAPARRSPLVPTSFGIYAVSDHKLYELDPLPGRAPDIRVAISHLITTPTRTTLPDGHIRFIVYRRDSATNAADNADVRLIAKVARETSFDHAGKPVVSKVDDSWVIRNVSIPYRTAPDKDNPDMYDIQSEDPRTALTPGRYALVLDGRAYDFIVAGAVTDPRHCLERLAATNGQFYSQCRKP